MADGTKIEWTDATVNAVNGCSVVSPGCTNCYAMRLAGTRLKHHPSRQGLTIDTKAGPVWNGEIRVSEKAMLEPLRWRRPRMLFWNAHGDLFHPKVPDEVIDRCFAVMALTPQHIHQVLTKRPERMRDYVLEQRRGRPAPRVAQAAHRLWKAHLQERGGSGYLAIPGSEFDTPNLICWALPNVWLGTSCEDQQRADERIPHLLATPAAVRFVSAEPLLGPIDLRRWLPDCYECGASCGLRLPRSPEIERCCECGEECGPETEPVISEGCPKCGGELEFVCPDCGHYMVYQHPDTPCLDWVIAGGESGPGARPMHPDWARSLRDQCAAAGVPFFFKQWGAWVTENQSPDDIVLPGVSRLPWAARDNDGGWTKGDQTAVFNVGKKAAGHLLDGAEHRAVPA